MSFYKHPMYEGQKIWQYHLVSNRFYEIYYEHRNSTNGTNPCIPTEVSSFLNHFTLTEGAIHA